MALAFSLHQPSRMIVEEYVHPLKMMQTQRRKTGNAETTVVLPSRNNIRAVGRAHLLQQAAKGPSHRA